MPIDSIRPIETQFKLPNGSSYDVKESELLAKITTGKMQYGLLPIYTSGIGEGFVYYLPPTANNDKDNEIFSESLKEVIDAFNRNDFDNPQRIKQLKQAFAASVFLKFYAIDMLLPQGLYLQKAYNRPDNILHHHLKKRTLEEAKKILRILIDCDAEYKHLLCDPNATEQYLQTFIPYFDKTILTEKIAKNSEATASEQHAATQMLTIYEKIITAQEKINHQSEALREFGFFADNEQNNWTTACEDHDVTNPLLKEAGPGVF